jgi:hypothetical protein
MESSKRGLDLFVIARCSPTAETPSEEFLVKYRGKVPLFTGLSVIAEQNFRVAYWMWDAVLATCFYKWQSEVFEI